MSYLVKQELKYVPFQILHEKVTLAGRKAVDSLVRNEEEAYKRLILRKEKEWTDTHEAPFEGGMEELYPFIGPDKDVIKAERLKAESEAMKQQIKELKLKEKALWLLPQVTAYIAKMPLPRLSNGLVDSKKFLSDNFSKDNWHKGLYRYCTVFQRGLIVPSQYTDTYKNYSALVPLLMMPFKKFDAIKYSEWSIEGLENVLDHQLYTTMISCPEDNEELGTSFAREAREIGLTYHSGDKKGEIRDSITSFKLYGLTRENGLSEENNIGDLPWLNQVMICQIWMAHPAVRTDLMVLHPKQWDYMPAPLIDYLEERKKSVPALDTSVRYTASDLEWLA